MKYVQGYSPGGAISIPANTEIAARTEPFRLFTMGNLSVPPTHLYVSILLKLADWSATDNSALILDKYIVDPPPSPGGDSSFQLYLTTYPTFECSFTFTVYTLPGPTAQTITIPSTAEKIPQTAPLLLEFVVDLDSTPYMYGTINRSIVNYRSITGTSIIDMPGEMHVLHYPNSTEPNVIIEQLIVSHTFPEWYRSNQSFPLMAFNFRGGTRDGYPWWYRVIEPRNYSHVYEFDKRGNYIQDIGSYPKPFYSIDSNVTFVEGDYGQTLRPERYMEMKGNRFVSSFKFLRPYFVWKRTLGNN